MTHSNHLTLGQLAEDFAAEMLEFFGYKIIERNYEVNGIEVDLIVQNLMGDVFVVEVKRLKHPEYSGVRLGKVQRQRLERACSVLRGKIRREVSLLVAFCLPEEDHIDVYDAEGEIVLGSEAWMGFNDQ